MCVVYECIIYIYKYTCTYKLQLLRAEEKDVHCLEQLSRTQFVLESSRA